MSAQRFVVSEKHMYVEVKAYVKNGLPKDHFLRDIEESSRKKIWYDNIYDDYENFPRDILYSARFRDGLTAESNVYSEFLYDFNYTRWIEEFIEHNQIVFDYLLAKEDPSTEPSCCENPDLHYIQDFCTTRSGHKGVKCGDALKRANFLCYCMDNIGGYQSQTYMRVKLFQILGVEVDKLPKTWSKTHKKPEVQAKWLHAL